MEYINSISVSSKIHVAMIIEENAIMIYHFGATSPRVTLIWLVIAEEGVLDVDVHVVNITRKY